MRGRIVICIIFGLLGNFLVKIFLCTKVHCEKFYAAKLPDNIKDCLAVEGLVFGDRFL